MSLVQVRLARDSLQTPWGFRLQGGKDLNQDLTVQRVFANTPSEGELQRGDVIVAINGRDTTSLSHKQAQDAISAGGGQIELLVQRPLGPVNIKPLTPAKDTRAPSFPQSPTRAPQVTIPIQKFAGPTSPPSRIIPISPQKPTPPKPVPRQAAHFAPAHDHVDMASGFSPKKVTLNKFGGGGFDFGSSYGGPPSPQRAPASHSYRPVAAPAAPVPTSPAPRGTIEYQTQFSAPQKPVSPQAPQEESGVDSEHIGGVGDTRRNFMKNDPAQMRAIGEDENDYPTAPVWERRKMFGARGPPKQAVQRSRKPLPSYGRPKSGDISPATFGVDYTKPQPHQQQQPSKYATQKRERPPPVNRRGSDELDSGTTPWSNTLRPEGRQLKPWEKEALEAEKYQSAPLEQPYRPHTQPATAPKPKIVQISGGQGASPTRAPEHAPYPGQMAAPAPAGYRSVSPVVPPKPVRSQAPAASGPPFQSHSAGPSSYGATTPEGPKPFGAPSATPKAYQPVSPSARPVQQPQQQMSPNAANNGDVSDPAVVHLQYNTPIGLYSRDNIRDTYIGQTRALTSGPQQGKKPVAPGERDWNDSVLAQMVQKDDRRQQPGPPGPGYAQHQAPQQQQYQQQPQQQQQANFRYDADVGMSDF